MFSIFSQRFLLFFYFSYSEMSSIVVVIKDLCTILTHYEIIRILYKIKISKNFSDLFLNNINIKIFCISKRKAKKKIIKYFALRGLNLSNVLYIYWSNEIFLASQTVITKFHSKNIKILNIHVIYFS